jgi:hypothetical protein
MGRSLKICLDSIHDLCPGFSTVLYDDNSDCPETREVIAEQRSRLYDVVVNTDPKAGQRHGHLYANIRNTLDRAEAEGFTYLFMIQDDMQFVRPFSPEVRDQYLKLFTSGEQVLQVDPRFLRRGEYEMMSDIAAYRHGAETAYADVGLTHIARLRASGWTLREGEDRNRKELAKLGYQRLFPFSPIMMHVPFPKLFRRGKRKFRPFPLNRGKYSFHTMTDAEISGMDARPFNQLPLFRTFLRPKNMRLSRLSYRFRKDTKIFT